MTSDEITAKAKKLLAFCDAWEAKHGTDWIRTAFDADLKGHELRTGDIRAIVELIDQARAAVTEVHLAYDRRQHGGVAHGHLFDDLQRIFDMRWRQGVALAAITEGK